MVAALNAIKDFENKDEQHLSHRIIFPEDTIIGSLAKYISTPNSKFQPMNANFGILPQLEERIKDKKLKYTKLADRAIKYMGNTMNNLDNLF